MFMAKKTNLRKQIIYLFLLVFIFVLVLGLNARISEYFRLSTQEEEMELRINNLLATQEALETQIAYANSDKAVEEWARTYERMGYEGDMIVIPMIETEANQEIDYVAPPDTSANVNWETWWNLFFE